MKTLEHSQIAYLILDYSLNVKFTVSYFVMIVIITVTTTVKLYITSLLKALMFPSCGGIGFRYSMVNIIQQCQ